MDFQYIQMIFIAIISVVNGEMLQLSENEIDMQNIIKNISVVTITACYMHCSNDERCSSIGLTRTSREHLQTCHLLRKGNKIVEKGDKLAVIEVGNPADDVDGKYTAWSSYGPCSSKVCGVNGMKQRHRNCTNPSPKGNGKDCCHYGGSREVATCAPCKHMFFATPHTLTKSKLIGTISTWHKVFKVQIQLKIDHSKITKNKWYNVVHFTKGRDNLIYGDRVPAVFLKRDATHVGIQVASAVQETKLLPNPNYYVSFRKEYDYFINWVKIDISQRLDVSGVSKKYMYRVAVDDHVITDVENNDARDFKNVKIFASDNWYSTIGEIKSFRVEGADGLIIP